MRIERLGDIGQHETLESAVIRAMCAINLLIEAHNSRQEAEGQGEEVVNPNLSCFRPWKGKT